MDELPARLALLFERLPKLLTEKKKVAKCKLRNNFPHFTAVVTTLVDGYIEGKMRSCEALLDALDKIIPDRDAEEHMKFAKYFTATRSKTGGFESTTAFVVTAPSAEKQPPGLVVIPTAALEGLLPGGTVEDKDQR